MLQVLHVPAFSDHYIWLLTDEVRQYAAIVDPGDAQPVIDELQQRSLEPVAILITHHHHVGGIARLLEAWPSLPVFGPANERIPHMTQSLMGGDHVYLDKLDISLQVMDIPGHTAGHIAYYGAGRLFCGDTLFGNGCGRVFDGSLSKLHESLQQIAQLPKETLIYCAHEYTLDNIAFAKLVEPDNMDLELRLEACWTLRENGRPTVPFSLDNELKSNPFLRTHVPEVITKAEEVAGRALAKPVDVFATLRIWKDTEYD